MNETWSVTTPKSKAPNKKYDKGWEKVFGKAKKKNGRNRKSKTRTA